MCQIIFVNDTTVSNRVKSISICTNVKKNGAELCQAQVKLEVAFEVRVVFGVEVVACHY